MTDQSNLERGYRRLLAWYPRAFRREHEQEILAVLMACAPEGQRRPGLAESADLIRSGLWMRLRPSVPRSARTVRAAVRLMYLGAAISAVPLIIALAYAGDVSAYHLRWDGHSPTAAQISQWRPLIILVAIVIGLAGPALWLWMARANGRGQNWARILSTVLFSVATLDLPAVWGDRSAFEVGVIVPGPIFLLTWLVGGAAVWLLWCPASSAFFKPPGFTQTHHQAQLAELARQAQLAELARIRARFPHQV